jgi:hypothetical protein
LTSARWKAGFRDIEAGRKPTVKPVVVVCNRCDSLLGNVVVHGEHATWQPHEPMRRDQRAEFRELYPEGLPAVPLDESADSDPPEAYCPNGHAGFDTSKVRFRAAAEQEIFELRLEPGILEP